MQSVPCSKAVPALRLVTTACTSSATKQSDYTVGVLGLPSDLFTVVVACLQEQGYPLKPGQLGQCSTDGLTS